MVQALRFRDIAQGIADYLAQFDAVFAGLPERLAFDAGGVRFSVASNLPGWLEGAVPLLQGAGQGCGEAVRIAVVDAASPFRGLRWADAFYHAREVEMALEPTPFRLVYMPEYGFWQVYDRAARVGVQWMETPGSRPPWDGGAPLRAFLHWMLAGADRGLVHAGTLACGDAGVLLAGAGGSGKSGTVIAGVLAGLATVGDDYVLAALDAGPVAMPVFNTLKQDPAGFGRLGLGRYLDPAPPLNWQEKHQFTLRALTGAGMPARIGLRAILLPKVAGVGPSRLAPATPREAFLALAPSSLSQNTGERGGSVAFIARLTRMLPCHVLHLGPDPVEVAGFLREFIEGGAA